ncbi:hypothetical protein HK096_006059, partial [Nowakowskiella sp. JEL0078]
MSDSDRRCISQSKRGGGPIEGSTVVEEPENEQYKTLDKAFGLEEALQAAANGTDRPPFRAPRNNDMGSFNSNRLPNDVNAEFQSHGRGFNRGRGGFRGDGSRRGGYEGRGRGRGGWFGGRGRGRQDNSGYSESAGDFAVNWGEQLGSQESHEHNWQQPENQDYLNSAQNQQYPHYQQNANDYQAYYQDQNYQQQEQHQQQHHQQQQWYPQQTGEQYHPEMVGDYNPEQPSQSQTETQQYEDYG